MADPEGRAKFYIIRTEGQSWLLFVVGLGLAVVSLLLYLSGDHGIGQLVMTILLVIVTAYSLGCVVWHRRHRPRSR